MLTFRNTNLFFVGLSSLILVFGYFGVASLFLLIPLFIFYSLIVAYGCLNIQSNFFMPIYCSSNTSEKIISISFDDGPSENYTAEILKNLKEYQAPATFFCIGKNLENNKHLVEQIIASGHIIGNHSYSHHFWFDLFSSKKMLEDMRQMDDWMLKLTGLKPRLFRPPYGVMNPNLRKAILNGNYLPVGWNVRSLDTVAKDENEFLSKIIGRIKPGAIFLFHDTCKITRNCLPTFLKEVNNLGYQVVSLDKLLHLKPYA